MKFLKNTIGFIAIFAALPAFAVTTRASVTGATVASRYPTIAAAQRMSTVSQPYATTAASLLDNSDCVDAYTTCMKAENACGDDFSECTNRVLFHGKMAQCLGTLTQCNASGLQLLFGASSINALGTISSCKKYNTITTGGTNTCKEVGDYTYPAAGSVLGQMIDSAYISTRLDTSKCVSRYTTCLKGATVCGADFGLCTSDAEFKKQKVFCESTLARCETAGIRELFGNDTGDTLGDGRIRTMITEASDLAGLNAVQNCYNVADNCVQTACKRNPYKCKSGVAVGLVDLTEQVAIRKENPSATINMANVYGQTVESDVAQYIRNQCFDAITANKSCFMTFNENNKASAKDMADTFNQELVFNEAYNTRMSSSAMQTKINGYIEDFDKQQKSECVELIGQCAIGACGGGNNAVCYSKVFGNTSGKATNALKTINHSNLYTGIKNVCEAVINTTPACIYAAANIGSNGIGNYNSAYVDGDAFATLFPMANGTDASDDPLGVIAMANSTLASAFTPAEIAKSKTECQASATKCIKKLCGTDYVNCYRNRSDVYSTLTNTNDEAFNRSMNKVGGVLDYTIVLGLCLDTVKNSESCETHLAIEASKISDATQGEKASWLSTSGSEYSNIRAGWLDAGTASKMNKTEGKVQSTNANGEELCSMKEDSYSIDVCDGVTYTEKVMVTVAEYAQEQAANGIFRDLIYDAEKEAQAIYNAKLTAEQNACLAMNRGGIVGSTNAGSTYAWVKLRNGRVPSSYANDGLSANAMVASNEIYNSFCRVRVMVTSDDKNIQDYMRGKSWATAYFAVGDPFVCGSWIPGDDLTEIAKKVAGEKTGTDENGKLKKGQQWATAGISLLGAGLGAGITDVLQTKTGLGGLLGSTNTQSKKNTATTEKCVKEVDAEISKWNAFMGTCKRNEAKDACDGYTYTSNTSISGQNYATLPRFSYKTESDSTIPLTWIEEHVKNLSDNRKGTCNVSDGKENKGLRAGMDVVGAALGAGVTGIATWQAMKASNRAKFTEAQQEFMDEVGSKINCVIGNDGYDSAQQLGTYGDMMMSELDTPASTPSTATAAGTASAIFR